MVNAVSFSLKSHSNRHKIFIGSIGVLLVSALGVTSNLAMRSIGDQEAAVKQLHSGLDLMADGKLEEGLQLLEAADAKSPHICQTMTNGWDYSGQTYNSDNLPPELRLKRLDGLRILRNEEPWVSEERSKLLESLSQWDKVIDIKLKNQNPWYLSTTNVTGVSEPLPGDSALANLYWQQHRDAEALAQIDRAVALYPWNTETRALAEKIYKSQKQLNKLKLLEQRNMTEDEVQTLISSASSYNDESKAKNLKALNNILAAHPWCAAALICRSANYLESKKTKQSMQDANAILALYPGLAEGYVRRAKVYEELQKPSDALRDYENALKSMPYSHELINEKRTQAKSLKLTDKILQTLDDDINSDPRNVEFYKDKAEFLQTINRFKDAEATVDKGIALGQFERRCRRVLRYGDYDRYQDDFNSTKLIELYKVKADVRASQNDYDGAVKTIDSLLVEIPKNSELLNKKVRLLIDAKKFDQALVVVNNLIADQEKAISLPIVGWFNLTDSTNDGSGIYEMPSGGHVSYEATSNLEKRIEIYAGLKDRANELKDRHSLLQLQRLELTETDQPSRYFSVMCDALELPDRDVALNIADRLCKHKKSVTTTEDIKNFCEQLSYRDRIDPELTIEVLDRLDTGLLTKFPELSDSRAAMEAKLQPTQ